MAMAVADTPESDAAFYDAEEVLQVPRRCAVVRRRRFSSDFPEHATSTAMGPWRTTEVERREESSWLLVGRRHSVDERRDALEQGKALFLRVLAARADGPWRARTAACADEIQAMVEHVRDQLEQQEHSLREARDFWAERHNADRAYLERLQASASAVNRGALPPSQACWAMDWRLGVQRTTDNSAAWAEQLPHLIERHEQAAAEVRRAVARASGDAESASALVRAARAAVWPVAARAVGQPRGGSHSADSGPDGACLWQAVRQYLTACDGLHGAQRATLARLRREERRLVSLGRWVEDVLGRASSDSVASLPLSVPQLAPGSKARSEFEEEREEQEQEREQEQEEGYCTSEGTEEEEVLDLSMDVSALVIHEQNVEVCRDALAEGSTWDPSHLLLSVDLWLHMWTPADLPHESAPTESLALAQTCLRPVAIRSDDPRVLRLMPRPQRLPGLLERLGGRLWAAPESAPCGLTIRCCDAAACEELLGALELVEKLYPTLE